jgi:hypothetical protein
MTARQDARTGLPGRMPGQGCQDRLPGHRTARTARAGQEGEDSHKKQSEQDSQHGTADYETRNEKWYLYLTYIFLKTLAFPPAEWLWLWNRVSSAVQQREEKASSRTFFFHACCFRFFRAPALIYALRLQARSAKKRGRSPLILIQPKEPIRERANGQGQD